MMHFEVVLFVYLFWEFMKGCRSISTRHSISTKEEKKSIFVMNIFSCWLSPGCCSSSSHLFCYRKVRICAPSEIYCYKRFCLKLIAYIDNHENNGKSVYISASWMSCDDCNCKLLSSTTWVIIDTWSKNMHGCRASNMYIWALCHNDLISFFCHHMYTTLWNFHGLLMLLIWQCSKWQAFKLATLSGFAEPLGVIIVGMNIFLFVILLFMKFWPFLYKASISFTKYLWSPLRL